MKEVNIDHEYNAYVSAREDVDGEVIAYHDEAGNIRTIRAGYYAECVTKFERDRTPYEQYIVETWEYLLEWNKYSSGDTEKQAISRELQWIRSTWPKGPKEV